jgi:hypothetical protein
MQTVLAGTLMQGGDRLSIIVESTVAVRATTRSW